MNPTTVTTPDELEIRVERIFDAPRAHVFSVWTDPQLIPEWWGDGTVVEEMDVRPGGTYRFRTAFGVVEGEYREIEAPERLVQTLQNHLQTLLFEDLRERTKLTQTMRFATGEERDTTMQHGVEEGANQGFARVDALLQRLPEAAPTTAEAHGEDTPVSDTLAGIPTAAVPYADSRWQPIRNHFGLTAFGINGYTALRAGDRIIGEHDHSSPEDEKHQELYFVHSGRARFEVDGAVIDAPAGTFVSVRDVATRRAAIAEEDNTVVLVIGAEPGAAFEITPAEREELADAGLSVRPA